MLSKVLKDLCRKTFKTVMKEIFKRHKGNIFHIYWLEELILLIHSYYPQLSTYSLQSLSNSKAFFTKQREKNSTTCIKLLLLFSCRVMSDSLWLHSLQHTRLPSSLHVLEFAQVRAHWIGDACQPSHPLSPSFSSVFNLSKHQGLFQWVSYSH